MNRKNKIKGCLIGGAIGDALGYPIEFKKNIKDKQYNKYKNDKGIISDDTQMTLFTANALLWRETRLCMRGISLSINDALYYAYLDWYETQTKRKNENSICWIKKLPQLNVERIPGNTCLTALASGRKGTIKKPINESKGCGGVMRVAPIGLYAKTPDIAGRVSALDLIDAVKKSLELYEENYKLYGKKYRKDFIELINKTISLSQKDYVDIDVISSLGEGWVAEEALAIALYSCLKYPKDFEKAIVCAVNHDGDSDSTGAIAGNIMGAYVGYDNLAKYFVENIELKDEIMEIADDLSIDIPVSEYLNDNDKYWLSKYLYCNRDLNLKK